jgi:hypothetical protein
MEKKHKDEFDLFETNSNFELLEKYPTKFDFINEQGDYDVSYLLGKAKKPDKFQEECDVIAPTFMDLLPTTFGVFGSEEPVPQIPADNPFAKDRIMEYIFKYWEDQQDVDTGQVQYQQKGFKKNRTSYKSSNIIRNMRGFLEEALKKFLNTANNKSADARNKAFYSIA